MAAIKTARTNGPTRAQLKRDDALRRSLEPTVLIATGG